MLKILLLGNTGQLGWELERSLASLGQVTAVDTPAINLAEPHSILPVIRQANPQVIINATAYTAVDRAESEPGLVQAINAHAPGLLAEEGARLGAALIHYSTDYVFDGTKGSPYNEEDTPNPLGVYGWSKLSGEQAVLQAGGAALVLRTSWVYSLRRDSFVTKVLAWARQQPAMRLVTDQVSGPTWARALAEITALLLSRGGSDPVGWLAERRGLYHLGGDGYCSRLEWGQAILHLDRHPEEQLTQTIAPALTVDFPTPARRPLFSALDCSRFTKTFGLQLPPWEQALRLAMEAG
ncbi:MAG TPA: dTDP-4-dehydrorhamnose reductase [Anaerolineales bacterium]|nr:dTDP-4-dehydrorhamnose reductase [Anaerolineales bacterium]